MITSDFLVDLKEIVPEDQIKQHDTQDLFLGNAGEVAVYPKSEEEIAAILAFANKNEKKVIVEGEGTKKGFGGTVETADILLSLRDYKGIIEHTVGDMTMTVKAGTPFKELQDYLATYNQMIPLDPDFPEEATLGGVIAANESGPKRLSYGSARDLIIGLRVVYPDGKVIRSGGKVVKNVAGYDMNKLFIGSMGTIGVLSEITLKLRPIPKYESLMLVSFPQSNLEEIRTFAIDLLDSFMEPHALELLSPSLAEELTGNRTYTLAISFEDVRNSVLYQEEYVKGNLPLQSEVRILPQQEAKDFWTNLSKVPPNGRDEKGGQPIKASLKIGVKNLDVLNIIRESQLMHDAGGLDVKANGGLGHGLCRVILTGSPENVLIGIDALTHYIKKNGAGHIIVKHLPVELRQKVKVWDEKPSYFFLLEGIKTKIDPNKTLNPTRFVGGL